jgi:hypothetical protein
MKTKAVRIFEITNPHDRCLIETNDVQAAATVVLLLGHGKYGLREEGGEGWEMPILAFGGGADAWYGGHFGESLNQYLAGGHELEMAAALESVRYAGERTSTVDFNSTADSYAKWLRRKARDEQRLVVESPDAKEGAHDQA